MTEKEKNKILKEVKRCLDNNKAFIICTPDMMTAFGTKFITCCMLKLIYNHQMSDMSMKNMYKHLENINDKEIDKFIYKASKTILNECAKDLDQYEKIMKSIKEKIDELL